MLRRDCEMKKSKKKNYDLGIFVRIFWNVYWCLIIELV